MKTIIHEPVLRDQHGEGQPGSTVVAYPHGTQTNGTNYGEIGHGKYKATFDPTANNGIISRYYDVYVDGVIDKDKKFIAEWVWYITKDVDANPLEVSSTPEDFSFSNLYDENGEALPSTIPNAKVEIMYAEKGRNFFLTSTSNTGFTIQAQKAMEDDAIIGNGNTIKIHIKITVGEA